MSKKYTNFEQKINNINKSILIVIVGIFVSLLFTLPFLILFTPSFFYGQFVWSFKILITYIFTSKWLYILLSLQLLWILYIWKKK